MSPTKVDGGKDRISSHVQEVLRSTSPSTLKDHVSVDTVGVTSAVRTGH
jgi:hypothetical protein